MDRDGVIGTLLLMISGVVLLFYSPDLLTTGIIVVMCILLITAYGIGLLPVMQYLHGLRASERNILKAAGVDAQNVWLVIRENDTLFGRQDLDDAFCEYGMQVDAASRRGEVPLQDVEDYINETLFYNHAQRGVMQQMPGTLTGLGILGTFMGLLIGLRSLGFSSETSTIESIQILLSGVRTAFYTSVAGVIFSIIFTIFYSRLWGRLMTELDSFYALFHKNVMPDTDTLLREQQLKYQREMLDKLDQLAASLGGKDSQKSTSDPAAGVDLSSPAARVAAQSNAEKLKSELHRNPESEEGEQL